MQARTVGETDREAEVGAVAEMEDRSGIAQLEGEARGVYVLVVRLSGVS